MFSKSNKRFLINQETLASLISQGFTVVNQLCPSFNERALKITFTVPLKGVGVFKKPHLSVLIISINLCMGGAAIKVKVVRRSILTFLSLIHEMISSPEKKCFYSFSD